MAKKTGGNFRAKFSEGKVKPAKTPLPATGQRSATVAYNRKQAGRKA